MREWLVCSTKCARYNVRSSSSSAFSAENKTFRIFVSWPNYPFSFQEIPTPYTTIQTKPPLDHSLYKNKASFFFRFFSSRLTHTGSERYDSLALALQILFEFQISCLNGNSFTPSFRFRFFEFLISNGKFPPLNYFLGCFWFEGILTIFFLVLCVCVRLLLSSSSSRKWLNGFFFLYELNPVVLFLLASSTLCLLCSVC